MADINLGKVRGNDATLNGINTGTLNGDTPVEVNSDAVNNTITISIENVDSFVTNTTTNLVNYYLKTETYTQTEIQTLVNSAISGVFVVVDTLPETGESNKIYLIPNTENPEIKDEYIWIETDTRFEKIGSTEINLANYPTLDTVEDLINTSIESKMTIQSIVGLENELNIRPHYSDFVGLGNVDVDWDGDIIYISAESQISVNEAIPYILTDVVKDSFGNPNTLTVEENVLNINAVGFISSMSNTVTALSDTFTLDTSVDVIYEVRYDINLASWGLYEPEIISTIEPEAPTTPSGSGLVPYVQPIPPMSWEKTSNLSWGNPEIDGLAITVTSYDDRWGDLYNPGKAFQNAINSGWNNYGTSTGKITIELEDLLILKSFSFCNGNNSDYLYPVRNFSINVSLDGVTYTSIYSGTSTVTKVGEQTTVDFYSNETAYKYYRFDINSTTGGGFRVTNFHLNGLIEAEIYSTVWVNNEGLIPIIYQYNGSAWYESDNVPPVGKITISSGIISVENYPINESFKYLSKANIEYLKSLL